MCMHFCTSVYFRTSSMVEKNLQVTPYIKHSFDRLLQVGRERTTHYLKISRFSLTMLRLLLIIGLAGLLQALSVPVPRHCALQHKESGLSRNYYENVAHTVHSMTVRGLRMFNPRAGPKNFVPTVNVNVSAPNKVSFF